jgi:hypothetical protein
LASPVVPEFSILPKLSRAIVANRCFNIVGAVERIVSIALTILFADGKCGGEIAELIGAVCERCGEEFVHLRMRIAEEICDHLTGGDAEIGGCLTCLLSVGIEAVVRLFLPQLKVVAEKCRARYAEEGLLRVVGMCVFRDRSVERSGGIVSVGASSLAFHRQIADVLGMEIVKFDGHQSVNSLSLF